MKWDNHRGILTLVASGGQYESTLNRSTRGGIARPDAVDPLPNVKNPRSCFRR